MSLTLRWKWRTYASNFAAVFTASSVQLSDLMNNNASPASGASRTMSAHAHPLPGFFHVPVAGS
ncbi:hypothetical protein [Streptomyces sp. NPDC052015]|uniref:hypothetical protein n=1 Tax=Streptomyces sp. NPDC052015 TaxID=3154755 RepID=UPI00343C883C